MRPAWRLLLSGLTCCVFFAGATGASSLGAVTTPDTARAASTLTVHESVAASLVSHRGATALNERGHGSGTFNCPLTIAINITYTRASIAFNCPTSRGTISGHGETGFYASGPIAHFTGTLQITSGTGAYAHPRSSSLHIVGTLRRGSYSLQASVTGSLTL
jgi:hypothetical protein